MKHMVIVNGDSSALLYVQEAMARGYKPIIVDPPVTYDIQMKCFDDAVGDKAIYIRTKSMDDQEEIARQLGKYDIVCVVPGSAGGVRYAEKLIDIMGFKGNGADSLWRRDTKDGMHQSLKEAGLRYIRTAVIRSEKDITDFFKDNGISAAFVKPSESTGSVGGKKCTSPEEAIAHYRAIKDKDNLFGWKADILIQEFIEGTEYIIDTVSCDGDHMVSDIWVYNKLLTDDGSMVYESAELLGSLQPGMHDLIEYAYKVLDAVGYKYGPCHGEFKIDDKGPVLIETNPRPLGASMTMDYLDETLGHHITDIAMDAYLDRDRFMANRSRPYRPLKTAMFKSVISPRETDASLMPFFEILKCLDSFRFTNPQVEDKVVHFEKTRDLESSPLMIKLCHSDRGVVRRDRDFLHFLETDYFDLIFSKDEVLPGIAVDEGEITSKYGWRMDWAMCDKKYLIYRNEGTWVLDRGKRSMIEAGGDDIYDAVFIGDTKSGRLSEKIATLRKRAQQVANGGTIIIIPEVFGMIPRGTALFEIVLNIMNFNVEVPLEGSDGALVATRNRSVLSTLIITNCH